MARGNRRKCKCCQELFRPDPRNRHHQRYCSAPAAEQPAKPPAKRAGSLPPRTRTSSTARCTWPGFGRGGRAILAIGARFGPPAPRYKMSQRRNPLILQE
jgi:hypothetical protein